MRIPDILQPEPEVSQADQVTEHLGLVYRVAFRLKRVISSQTTVEELVSSGVLGLMSALKNFTPEQGLAFSTYAVPRIQGAMLDGLRANDHVPRSIRKKERAIKKAIATVESRTSVPVTTKEVAEELKINRSTLAAWKYATEQAIWLRLTATGGVVDIEKSTDKAKNNFQLRSLEPDTLTALEETDEMSILKRALSTLPKRDRAVLAMYYFEGLGLAQIGRVLNLSEGRVSQIRSKLLTRLKEQLVVLDHPPKRHI